MSEIEELDIVLALLVGEVDDRLVLSVVSSCPMLPLLTEEVDIASIL